MSTKACLGMKYRSTIGMHRCGVI